MTFRCEEGGCPEFAAQSSMFVSHGEVPKRVQELPQFMRVPVFRPVPAFSISKSGQIHNSWR